MFTLCGTIYLTPFSGFISHILDAGFISAGEHSSPLQMKPENGVRYIVPHRVNIDNLKIGDKFFFRVDNIYRKCGVILKADENIIYSAKRPRVAPSEMESIELDGKILDGLNAAGDIRELVICLEK